MKVHENEEAGKAVAAVCSGCGASFVCGAANGLQTCWCMEVPAGSFEPAEGEGCYCSVCLKNKISVPTSPAA